MPENTALYFKQLAESGCQPLLHLVSGTMRFDIGQPDGSHQVWHLTIDHASVDVQPEKDVSRDVDCLLTGPEDEFARIVFGHDSYAAAFVRGAITVSGDPGLALSLRRFSPPACIVVDGGGSEARS